jgi:hypothetical protein
MPPRREGVNERVLRAVVYLEDGHTDLAPLRNMGLTARHLSEVLELVAWGNAATLDTRAAVERLFEAAAAAEEQAGLSTPVVVVREERPPRLGRVLAIVGAIAVVAAVTAVWIASHH